MSWPTAHNRPNKEVFVTCRFAPDDAADLQAAATASNMSKSAYVRAAVARVIAHEKRTAERLRTGEMEQT